MVGERDGVLNIRCDDAAGDGRKNVVHEVLERGYFFEALLEGREQTGIVDGDGCLIGERLEQVLFGVGEDAGADAVIRVDHADDLIFNFEGDAQNGAQVECDDAFLPHKTFIFLCVGRYNRFICVEHALHDGTADIFLRRVDGFHFPVACDAGDHFAFFVSQHQKTALRFREAHDVIHHDAEHFIQFK